MSYFSDWFNAFLFMVKYRHHGFPDKQSPGWLRNPESIYELQAKTDGRWKAIIRHPDREYLEVVGDKHFRRFKKLRVMKLK